MRRQYDWKTLALVCLLIGISSLGEHLPVEGSFPQLTVLAFGEPMQSRAAPLLIGGRVFVSAEALAETLGLSRQWDQKSATLYLNSYPGEAAARPTGKHQGYPVINLIVHGAPVAVGEPAILIGGDPYVPLRTAQEFGLQVGWQPATRTAFIGSPDREHLPRVGSVANLEKLLARNYTRWTDDYAMNATVGGVVRESADAAAPPAAEGKSADYSTTNTQVQGVDEADIVKTDGRYIYQVQQTSIRISQAYPATTLRLLATIDLTEQGITPVDLFIDGDRLLVIGQSSWHYFSDVRFGEAVDGQSKAAAGFSLMPPLYWQQKSSVLVYDITDRAHPALTRMVELGGSYLTARKVDSRVVLLANQPLYGGPIEPCYRDSAMGEDVQKLAMSEVEYFPERQGSSYLLTAVFDLQSDEDAAKVSAYLGAGDNVYMSKSNLYVATSRWWTNESNIYKLHLSDTELAFQARGTVPGYLLNQFSMDEWSGSLRVATTYDQNGKTENGVYILNETMQLTGELTAIAPGERIYSARFTGERGYLVTFEQVDPLFVLDLSDHRHPSILGALKIPGFSTYLHPLDDHRLLGIGRDTMVVEDKDIWGKVVSTRVLEKGLKLAIFDVTDLSNPKEQAQVLLGGRGSQSEALYNHKAVLYSPTKQLLALPVQLTAATTDNLSYGPTVFQGAVVYSLDLNQGFTELGRISHLTADELLKQGYHGYAIESQVRRLLYIEDNLYAISDGSITVHDLATIKQIAAITLP